MLVALDVLETIVLFDLFRPLSIYLVDLAVVTLGCLV
jgi:hypothetical protein